VPDFINPVLIAPVFNRLTHPQTTRATGTASVPIDLTRPHKRPRPATDIAAVIASKRAMTEPAPTTLPALLKNVTQCVLTHSLLTPIGHLRELALQESLTPFLSAALIEITRQYALEPALLPLMPDRFGFISQERSNAPVWISIAEIILADDPDKELFQLELTTHHGSNLHDWIINDVLHSARHRQALAAHLSNQPGALPRLRHDFRVLTNFLSHSQCVTQLNGELALLGTDPDINTEQAAVNIRLFIEAMQTVNPVAEKIRRDHELECRKADLFLLQAKAQLKANNAGQACESYFSALRIFCRLREKRRTIDVMIQITELCKAQPTLHYLEVLNFFSLTQKLCLSYPVDVRLYANLLFAMDSLLRQQSEHQLLNVLYQNALTELGLLLPDRYRAKILYRQIRSDYLSGKTDLATMHRLGAAINYFSKVFLSDSFQDTPSSSECRDLSRSEFLQCFAWLYQVACGHAMFQITDSQAMTAQRKAACLSLIDSATSFEERFRISMSDHPALRHDRITLTSRHDVLVQVSANYCKNALKILLVSLAHGTESDRAEKSLVAMFDNLVGFYLKYKQVAALEHLLDKKNILNLMQFADFKATLPKWSKALKDMKEDMMEDMKERTITR